MTTMRALIIGQMVWWDESWQDVEAVEIDFNDSSDGQWINRFKKNNRPANEYPFDENNVDVPLQSLTTDQLLDLEFYDGYGYECPIYPIVWTKNRIYYHHEYDGSDSIRSLPRHPKEQR